MLNLTEPHLHLLGIHYGLDAALCVMNKAWDIVLMELKARGEGGRGQTCQLMALV